MNYPSIRIEGAILSPDILGQVEELPGQQPADFALDSGTKIKDEIARAYANVQDYWRIFQRKLETLGEDSYATTETRNLWMVPLLSLLCYDIKYQPRGTELNGRLYPISHRATNRADTSVQIVGYRNPAGLDQKPANATRRMSAHALVQEFLNLHEQLYGLVTNGHVLRLLRDSSRLVKQSYLEFDLDRIFTDGLFADFAVLYRLLHATRLPLTNDIAAESLIERYHQDSLDSGARIRERLSNAVKQTILDFGSGLLSHPDNDALRKDVASGKLSASNYYQQLLRLIYRLLFLMVIEERDLIFPTDTTPKQRDIYRKFYSVARLRRLSEKRYLANPRRHNLWLALQACFRLFEADGPGAKLGIGPLAGDLFSAKAVGSLTDYTLGNDVLLGCLRSLSLYQHPDSNQLTRVNYAALNVEEFGSIYEGLLKYHATFFEDRSTWAFDLRLGDDNTQSHYTEDELVQPLIRHSLDYLIAECLKAKNPEAALLKLRIADIACGSGHILLAAARRIATELAAVRTGEEQPSPSAYRTALRDSICHCIYGVDLNPLAVELCKVALWLEAHIPGQPLNFLDHHIKCGNAIVGFARREELSQGVPTEAFKTLPGDGDDKEIASAFRKKNKEELKHQNQISLDFTSALHGHIDAVLEEWRSFSKLPEKTPAQIDNKKQRFFDFTQGEHADFLRTIANIPLAQFYIPKVPGNEAKLLTDGEFRGYLRGQLSLQGQGVNEARTMGKRKRFFHWFLEFPEVMDKGGFDCILGNPPYLGGKKLSGTYGRAFCRFVQWKYAPTGLSDLVVYFLRRMHELLRDGGFTAINTTNSIVDGNIRKDGLKQVVTAGAQINMAVRGVKWPGTANLVVSLLAVHKGKWNGPKMLDNQPVTRINTFFEAGKECREPRKLTENSARLFIGYYWLGKGFLLSQTEADDLLATNPQNTDVVFPVINGKEINSEPDQAPQRKIINFKDWPLDQAKRYPVPFSIVEEKVKPYRRKRNNQRNRDIWWLYAGNRPGLTAAKRDLPYCFVTANTTKHMNWSALATDIIVSHPQNVFTTDRWDLFAVVQSSLHEVWVRKYSGSLKQDLRYSPSKCFDTFAFPAGLWKNTDFNLAELGECYHEHRKALMQTLWLGLTKIYNLFHARDLSQERVAKISKKDADTATRGYEGLVELRRLHVELDLAVQNAYGWQDFDLEHGFHEIETLPENDRLRYTISPAARREVLKRLLAENHARATAEAKNSTLGPKRGGRRRESAGDDSDLFE